ncbi:MAG: hypothetical protein LBQ12_10940 [Deltaproteobacteria bacterium]|jgi:hypothetical protein|nr:hypothetical protein [Deltaproteobacteria bacterium]
MARERQGGWRSGIERAASPARARKLARVAAAVLVAAGCLALAFWFLAPRAERAEAEGAGAAQGAGLASPADSPAKPPKTAPVRSVLQNVLGLWAEGLLSGDYSKFHAALAADWKAKDAPADIAKVYKPLEAWRDALRTFPSRGKLVLLQSEPYRADMPDAPGSAQLRENVGPESPWLVRGEWRTGKTALNFTLILIADRGEWKPAGLLVEIFEK